MSDIEVEVREDGVAVLTLNRPEQRNAFTVDMVDLWAQRLRELAVDDAARVVVITGAGGSFCAGADTKKMAADADDPQRRAEGRAPITSKRYLDDHIHQVALTLETLHKPVIAAVAGPAVGAGMDMALACDIRYAGASARFSEAYLRAGLVPGNGGCYFLPRIVGMSRALEMLLTGDFVGAEEALEIGLVSKVVADEDLLPTALELAARIAAFPPVHVQLTKRAAYASSRMGLRDSLDLISSHTAVVRTMDDSLEALAAFREKRPGRYQGR